MNGVVYKLIMSFDGAATARQDVHQVHEVRYDHFMELLAQTEQARARIAGARSAIELRDALLFLADVAGDGVELCAELRSGLELLGRPPSLATRIDRADAIAGLLIDGLSSLARDAHEQAQEASALGELRVGARNLVWFAQQVSRLTDELVRLRESAHAYHDRVFATMYGDAERNAAEAARDAESDGSAVAADLDQILSRG